MSELANTVIKNQADFEKYVNNKIESLFKGDLTNRMKETLSESISKNVLTGSSSRSSSEFNFEAAFDESSGLADPKSFIVVNFSHPFSVEIFPGAHSQPPIFEGYTTIPGGLTTTFAELTESGGLLDLSTFFRSGGKVKKFRSPKPFIDEAQNEVDSYLLKEVQDLF